MSKKFATANQRVSQDDDTNSQKSFQNKILAWEICEIAFNTDFYLNMRVRDLPICMGLKFVL